MHLYRDLLCKVKFACTAFTRGEESAVEIRVPRQVYAPACETPTASSAIEIVRDVSVVSTTGPISVIAPAFDTGLPLGSCHSREDLLARPDTVSDATHMKRLRLLELETVRTDTSKAEVGTGK